MVSLDRPLAGAQFVPGVLPGHTAEDMVTARADYSHSTGRRRIRIG